MYLHLLHTYTFFYFFFLQPTVRLLSLRVLRDMVRTKPQAFNERNDKMIEIVLNAHKDSQKEVSNTFLLRQASLCSGQIVRLLVFVLNT